MALIRGNLIDGDRQTTARVEKVVRQKSPEKFKAPPRAKTPAPRQSSFSRPAGSQWQPKTTSSVRVPQKANTRDPAAEERRNWEESKRIYDRNKIVQGGLYDQNKIVQGYPTLNKTNDPNYIPTKQDPDYPLSLISDPQKAMRGVKPPRYAVLKKETPEEKKKRIEESNQRFYAERARNRRGTGDHREMTLEDYEALSPADRAAVDANSLLMEAVEKDKGFISELDQNNDGRVSSAEAKAKGTYGKNYEALFGNGGEDVTYAPNTVAALRLLEQGGFTVDDGDTIDNFLNGGRYVTARDMDLGRTTTESEERPSAAKITGSMAMLSMALEEGMAVINGQQGASINLRRATPEQRTALVESIQADMLAGRSFDALFNPESIETPVSLDAIYDEAYAMRRSGYQWMMDRIIEDPEVTEEAKITTLNTEGAMQQFAGQIGIDFDMSEWTDLLQQRVQTQEEE